MKNAIENKFLSQLLSLIKYVQNDENREDTINILKGIRNLYGDIQNKNSLWNTMDEMCAGISREYFILLEYIFAATHDENIIKKQLKLLIEGINKEEIDLFFAIFYKWQITSRIFMSYNFKSMYSERRNLQRTLANKLYKLLDIDFPFIDKPNDNRIVIVSTQLIGMKHGPSRNIMDYCYTIQKKLNKEVLLLITYEMPVDRNVTGEYEALGIEYRYFHHNKDIDGEFTVKYQDEVFRGYQCYITKNNISKIQTIIRIIYDWQPFLIYNIGGDNLIADICSTFTMGVCIPCAYRFPISEQQYLILPRDIEDSDKEIVNYIHERKQSIIESIYVYKLDEPITLHKREDYGYLKDEFIIAVVGTRLDHEIDTEFAKILNTILEIDKKIRIVFMGLFDNLTDRRKDIGYSDRVDFLGMQDDLRGAFSIVDLYLNPPRKGGGTSAVEAMSEGIPIITLPNCDVSYASANQFNCASIEEMPVLVERYKNDVKFYNAQSKKALYQAEKLINTKMVLSGIINNIQKAERRRININEKS